MKTPTLRRPPVGFTLIELLTVVTIIMILAGLTVGALKFFQRRQAEDKTRVQLKLLASALEDYKADNGEYPLSDSPSGEKQTNTLWKRLFNDGAQNDGTVYLAELDPNANGQGWLAGSGTEYTIMDGFGKEYRYRRLADQATNSQVRNPDFDLWSMGADGKTQTSPTHKDNRDDLWE